jgi:hypothetical protein
MSAARELMAALLSARSERRALDWIENAGREIAGGVPHARFAALVSLASRHVARGALQPSARGIEHASELVEGWNPERWTMLETARAMLVLSRKDLAQPSAVDALDEAFRYADIGEMCALHRSLQFMPGPERFVWRAGEGCRSSMRAVFEAAACDTPFPVKNFDDLAWRQLVIKALFVEAPLWRVYGLDARIDAELARMALDLADERRSAGRNVQPELWACLAGCSGERGVQSIERELAGSYATGRRAAALALARAGRTQRLAELARREKDPAVEGTMRSALEGKHDQAAFGALGAARTT